MAPSSSIEINLEEKARLLAIARQSIEEGLARGKASKLDAAQFKGILADPLGVFVTLTQEGKLRGCIGYLETVDPLTQSVANCAFNAAFHDPRFSALSSNEFESTDLEISILSEMEPMSVQSRDDLFKQLQPSVDGLLLEDGSYRSTFLPQVWKQLPDPQAFLEHLLQKAGLAKNYWSDSIRFYRYHSHSFHD